MYNGNQYTSFIHLMGLKKNGAVLDLKQSIADAGISENDRLVCRNCRGIVMCRRKGCLSCLIALFVSYGHSQNKQGCTSTLTATLFQSFIVMITIVAQLAILCMHNGWH